MKRATIERLSSDIAKLDRERRDRDWAVDESKLTDAERAFCAIADSRGKRVLRNGWPDFMVLDPESGGTMAVEVKTDEDVISAAQARMFEALEDYSIRVMIWCPTCPGKLTPWRKHELEKKARRLRRNRVNWEGARSPTLGRAQAKK
jgi:hypothetical protein